MLIKDFRDSFPEDLFYGYPREVIEECYRALDCSQIMNEKFDPYSDENYVNTARKYSNSLYFDASSHMEDHLLEARDRAEAAMSDYLINYLHLMNKYKARIKDGSKTYSGTITHTTYEYPKLITYPKDYKGYQYKDRMETFLDACYSSTNTKEIKKLADKIIAEFTEWYLGYQLSSDELEKASEISKLEIVGDPKDVTYTSSNLQFAITNLSKLSSIRLELHKLKKGIPAAFKFWNDMYSELRNYISNKDRGAISSAMYRSVPTMQNPDRTILLARTNSTLTLSDLDYNRIFTTFIRCYYYATSEKLKAITNKIEGNKKLATAILTELNLITALPDPKNKDPKVVFIKR